mgnify:FL=1
MFDLRPYQSEALAAIEASWSEGINRPAVVLPTGAGKTVCFSGLIASQIERLRKDGKRILVLAHREELLEQAEDKIKAMVPGIWTAIVKGDRGAKEHRFADVVIASVQTLARAKRRESVDRIGLVIVDECHRYAAKSYRAVLDHYGCMDDRQTPTVGFTATLTRMDGGLPDVWQAVAYSKKIHWMIKQGFLAPAVARSISIPGLNLSSTRITGGDLNTGDLSAALMDTAAFDVIADSWVQSASDRPTIAFMPDVQTAKSLAGAFQERDIAAEIITGETPSTERKAAYERFSGGTTRVLVSCMVLTEGFDAPHTSCVIIGRPTINPGLYIQMVGRGLRVTSGKSDCLVLDVAGASLNHSLAGVNDLESDCNSKCDCNCLSCGCTDRCKCGIRQCGCRCIEQHEALSKACRCAGHSGDCGCGCEGEQPDGSVHCVCNLSDDCQCRAGAPIVEAKEVHADVLRNLVEVDILGAELAGSSYTWLSTEAGIRFLAVGSDVNLFLLPCPDGGYFQGLVEGSSPKAPVKRLDAGALPADEARSAMEQYAQKTGFTYNNRKASWRRTPASGAQTSLLKRRGIEAPEGCRKGQASDLLAAAKVSRVLDARFGSYVQPVPVAV